VAGHIPFEGKSPLGEDSLLMLPLNLSIIIPYTFIL
jgi:hypothetical protein